MANADLRKKPMARDCDANASQNDILRELTEAEVHELMLLYRTKYGDSNFHYLLMYNQGKWNRILRNEIDDERWISFRKRFYTSRYGDFRKTGTYISLHFDVIQSVSFYTWQPSCDELLKCLRETDLIEWRNGPLLTNVFPELCGPVKDIAASKNARVQRARQCHGVILTREKALSLETPPLPEGYQFSRLLQENADTVHTLWANKKEGSLEYIRGLIKVNQTLGITSESSRKLVAWIFQNDFSGLGILEVLPEVQRRGFGTALAKALCKQIAEAEEVQLSAWFVNNNVKSESLLEKIGFRKTIMTEWIQLERF